MVPELPSPTGTSGSSAGRADHTMLIWSSPGPIGDCTSPAPSLTLLDIACGTGNQQIANRGLAPDARFVGLDGSLGMLRQARRKMPDIAWVHGDSAALPFAPGSFDFVSCQYAFHHFRDKAGMLREAFRVLRSVAWHDSSNRTCGFPCIRLSDKTSRLHPRHVAPKPGQTHEPEGLVQCGSGSLPPFLCPVDPRLNYCG